MTFVHQSIAPNAEVLNLPLTTAGGAITIPANTVYSFTVSLTSGSCTIVTDTDPQTTLTIASNSQNPYESPNLNGGRINHSITITPDASCDGFVSEAKVISSAPTLSLDITPPTATLVGAIPAATAGSAFQVTVTFADDVSINLATITTNSLSVTDGVNDATVSIVSDTGSATSRTVVFSVLATVAGNYTVSVPADGFRDSAGNQVAATGLGSATVSSGPTLNITNSAVNTAGDTLTLTFDSTLNSSLVPAVGAFTLSDGRTASAVNVPGTNLVTLTGITPVYESTDSPTYSYNPPGVNPLTGTNGATLAAVTNQGVTNSSTQDNTTPTATLSGAIPANTTVGSTYQVSVVFADSVSLDLATITTSSLSVTDGVNNATVAIASEVGDTLSRTVTFDVTPTVAGSYTISIPGDGFRDAAGNQVAATVLGSTTTGTAPTISVTSASINSAGDELAITLSSAMNPSFVPAVGAFTLSDGRTATAVSVPGTNVVTLTGVSPVYEASDSPTFDYTAPGVNPLTAQNGAVLASLSAQAVTNGSTQDNTAPTAVLSGAIPNPIQTNNTFQVAVVFADTVSLDLATITTSSISVTDGVNNATVAIASNTGDTLSRTVTFDVTTTVDGTYNVSVPVDGVRDVAGNQVVATTLGSTVSSTPDSVSPTASLVGVLPTATTGIAATVIVDFDDETAFNPASVTIGSLSAVDGANVATIAVASTTTIGNNGVRVNFDVTAPADGSYTVTVPVNSYSDAAGNQGALVNLGTMTVASADVVATLTNSLASVQQLPSFDVNVNFTNSTGGDVSASSLSVVNEAGTSQNVALTSTTPNGNGVDAVFTVTPAPGVDDFYFVTVPANGVGNVPQTYLGVQEAQQVYPQVVSTTPVVRPNSEDTGSCYFSITFDWAAAASEIVRVYRTAHTNVSGNTDITQRILMDVDNNQISIECRQSDSFSYTHMAPTLAPIAQAINAGSTYNVDVRFQGSVTEVWLTENGGSPFLAASSRDSRLCRTSCGGFDQAPPASVTNYSIQRIQPPADLAWQSEPIPFRRLYEWPLFGGGLKNLPPRFFYISVFDSQGFLPDDGLGRYYVYASQDHASNVDADIFLARASSPTLSDLSDFTAVITDTGFQIETPLPYWDAANSRLLLIAHSNNRPVNARQSTISYVSTDGKTFSDLQILISADVVTTDRQITHTGYANYYDDGSGQLRFISLGPNGEPGTQPDGYFGPLLTRTLPGDLRTTTIEDYPQLLDSTARRILSPAGIRYFTYNNELYAITTERFYTDTSWTANLRQSFMVIRKCTTDITQYSRRKDTFALDLPWETNPVCVGVFIEGSTLYVYYQGQRVITTTSSHQLGVLEVSLNDLNPVTPNPAPSYILFDHGTGVDDTDITGRSPDTVDNGNTYQAVSGGSFSFTSSIDIFNNTITRRVPGGNANALAVIDYGSFSSVRLGVAVYDLSLEAFTVGSGMIFRFVDNNNFGWLRAFGDGRVNYNEVVGGVNNLIISATIQPITNTEIILYAETTPTELRIYAGGVLLHTQTGDYSTPLPFGPYIRGAETKIDYVFAQDIS